MPTGLFSTNAFNHVQARFKKNCFYLVPYDCNFSVHNDHSCQKYVIAIIFTLF